MKKWDVFLIMIVVVIPLISMEKENVVRIRGDISVIFIKESNLVSMKALHKYSQFHKEKIRQCGILPRYPHVCSDEICLVDQALTVRPDKFQDYYNKLSKQDRLLLIKSSGQYNEDGKKVMLDAPEVTKRLLDVCFPKDLCMHIKSYLKNEDEDYVRNFFKEQLIYNKSGLFLKERITNISFRNLLSQKIYLGSLFFNGCHAIHPYNYPISLRTGDTVRQTYGICFALDNYEYRITDVKDKQCLLWVINHDNPSATFSTVIKHKEKIKGCCVSNTQTDVEGVLTFSDHDMVFSTITTLNGLLYVESVPVDSPHDIVDARFEPDNREWSVVVYEDRNNVGQRWSMQGKYENESSRSSFKAVGLLEKFATYQTTCGDYLVSICNVAHLYSTEVGKSDGGGIYINLENKPLLSLRDYEYDHSSPIMIKVGDSVEAFYLDYSFFAQTTDDNLSNSGVHNVYSPDGELLMCNSLKTKMGMYFVETVIKDAITHKQILSIDTLYTGFMGVGFSHDSTELIFLETFGANYKMSLLNHEDKQILSAIEDKACTNLGVASVMKRLSAECRENGYIRLDKKDSTYAMLCEWFQSSDALKAFSKLLPMRTKK